MITTTKVISVKKDSARFFFETKTITLQVNSFQNGVAHVTGMAGDFAKDVIWSTCGCFLKSSNFEKKLQKCFDTSQPLDSIMVDLIGIPATISRESHDPLSIFQEWKNKIVLS